MIDLSIIKQYHHKTEIYEETEDLKRFFNEIKEKRDPFFLRLEEVEKILHWKLISQYHRQKKKREIEITDEIVQEYTGLAFRINHRDKNYEVYLKLNTLMVPRGFNIGIASAILTLCFPEKYAVIDFRVWKQIFSEERKSFTINQYIKYLRKLEKLSEKLRWTPQEVDLALWAYDKEKNP